MRIGTAIPHTGKHADPVFLSEYVQTADELGIDLWAVDHIALPETHDSAYTLGAKPRVPPKGALAKQLSPNYELISTLGFVAGQTRHVRVGSCVLVLPIRSPVLNAHQLATIDALSGGRLVCGVGIGWLQEEAELLGMPWDRRGKRSEEHIAVLRELWSAEAESVEFHGEFFDVPPILTEPRPARRGGPPIYVGGHSDAALRRAARCGDGWIAGSVPVDRASGLIERLRSVSEQREAPLAISMGAAFLIQADPDEYVHHFVSPEGGLAIEDVDEIVRRVRAYEALGVDDLRLNIAGSTPATMLAALERLGREVAPAVAAESS